MVEVVFSDGFKGWFEEKPAKIKEIRDYNAPAWNFWENWKRRRNTKFEFGLYASNDRFRDFPIDFYTKQDPEP